MPTLHAEVLQLVVAAELADKMFWRSSINLRPTDILRAEWFARFLLSCEDQHIEFEKGISQWSTCQAESCYFAISLLRARKNGVSGVLDFGGRCLSNMLYIQC